MGKLNIEIASMELKEKYLRQALNDKAFTIYNFAIDGDKEVDDIYEVFPDWDVMANEIIDITMTVIKSGCLLKSNTLNMAIIYILAKHGYNLNKLNGDTHSYSSIKQNISKYILKGYAGLALAEARRKIYG